MLAETALLSLLRTFFHKPYSLPAHGMVGGPSTIFLHQFHFYTCNLQVVRYLFFHSQCLLLFSSGFRLRQVKLQCHHLRPSHIQQPLQISFLCVHREVSVMFEPCCKKTNYKMSKTQNVILRVTIVLAMIVAVVAVLYFSPLPG